jgi:hypothetical protein
MSAKEDLIPTISILHTHTHTHMSLIPTIFRREDFTLLIHNTLIRLIPTLFPNIPIKSYPIAQTTQRNGTDAAHHHPH